MKHPKSNKVKLKKVTSKYGRRLFVICFIALICGIGIFFLSNKVGFGKTRVSDAVKARDLYSIQKSIIGYFTKNNQLPETLKDLQVNLEGKAADYVYTYKSRVTNGGPTISYKLCTKFANKGLSFTDKQSLGTSFIDLGNGPDVYHYHRKGYQCYDDGYYKGASHVQLLLEPNEVIPLVVKANQVDFEQFTIKAQNYFEKHTQVLGIARDPHNTRLVKGCVKQSYQTNTPNKQAYTCFVRITENASIAGENISQQKLNELEAVLQQDGFTIFNNSYADRISFDASKEECNVEAEGILYRITCTAKDTDYVPTNFSLVDNFNVY